MIVIKFITKLKQVEKRNSAKKTNHSVPFQPLDRNNQPYHTQQTRNQHINIPYRISHHDNNE
jgi:hypothetical protein